MYTNYQLVFDARRVAGNRIFGKRFFATSLDAAKRIAKEMVIELIGNEVLRFLEWKIVMNSDSYHSWMMVLEGVPKECLPEELKSSYIGGKIFFWPEENIPLYRGKGNFVRDGNIPKRWIKIEDLPREEFGGRVQVPGGSYSRSHRDKSIYYVGGNTYAIVTHTVDDIQGVFPVRVYDDVEFLQK